MYKALTQVAAISLFKNKHPENGMPVFSDMVEDVAHFDLDDCIAASVEICESLEVKEPLAHALQFAIGGIVAKL